MADDVTYEKVREELDDAVWRLRSADRTRVATEVERLRRLAEQIEDPLWRQRALHQVQKFPEPGTAPSATGSEQLRQAQSLSSKAFRLEGSAEQRIAELQRLRTEIGDLSGQAPPHERLTILRLNSAITRMIAELEHRRE
jgi:hypothetical protein